MLTQTHIYIPCSVFTVGLRVTGTSSEDTKLSNDSDAPLLWEPLGEGISLTLFAAILILTPGVVTGETSCERGGREEVEAGGNTGLELRAPELSPPPRGTRMRQPVCAGRGGSILPGSSLSSKLPASMSWALTVSGDNVSSSYDNIVLAVGEECRADFLPPISTSAPVINFFLVLATPTAVSREAEDCVYPQVWLSPAVVSPGKPSPW